MAMVKGGGGGTARVTSSDLRRDTAAAARAPRRAPRPTAVRRAPVRQQKAKSATRYNPPSRRSTGRRGAVSQSSGRGQGAGRSMGSAAIRGAPGAAPGAVPNLQNFLAGDVDYQNFLRGGKRTLADFLNELGRERTEGVTSFNTSKADMNLQRERGLEAIMNEFASRGLLKSGLLAEEQGDFNRDWQTQMTAMEQAHQGFLGDLTSQQRNFEREQALAQEAARQEALRRRAERYGI